MNPQTAKVSVALLATILALAVFAPQFEGTICALVVLLVVVLL